MSPTRDIDLRDASAGLLTMSPRMVNTSSNEYMNRLAQDNATLHRRLTVILHELDRVNRDRSKTVQEVGDIERQIS